MPSMNSPGGDVIVNVSLGADLQGGNRATISRPTDHRAIGATIIFERRPYEIPLRHYLCQPMQANCGLEIEELKHYFRVVDIFVFQETLRTSVHCGYQTVYRRNTGLRAIGGRSRRANFR